MSILDTTLKVDKYGNIIEAEVSQYQPDDNVKDRIQMVRADFTLGDTTMKVPRREFNDLCVLERMTIDQMNFNTYQPNNGDALEGDEINGWKSRAIRPIVRNRTISIAAHATARLIFPKVFAYDDNSDEDKDAAQVMRDLMEWSGEQSNYEQTSLYAVISALVNPASIVYTEYAEVFNEVKTTRNADGTWNTKKMLNETLSGFQDTIVPVDELYIENFYEHDIQKQGWLIWRRVISYSLARQKYGHMENFKYIKPGVQNIYNDANQTFYSVYDSNMRPQEVEEIIYWNKSLDVKLTMVNGVMLSDWDEANPRQDKLYPFTKFGYELIDEGKCFYYKSLVFKMSPDANIINTLYPMIIDGTYLNLMPPMVVSGSEMIGSDVIIPGAVTTLSDKDASITPIGIAQNLSAGLNALSQVEESIDQSSQDPLQGGDKSGGNPSTAFEISRLEQNAATVLGLFIKMIGQFVKGYGTLRMNDIVQYLTIADIKNISETDLKLFYQSFVLPEQSGRNKSKKIIFDGGLPNEMDDKMLESLSLDVLEEQGGLDSKKQIFRVNPELFRNLKYKVTISPDVLNPMSDDLERAFMLEEYDRAINNPLLDQEQVTRDFLLGAYPKSKRDPDKYMAKNNATGMEGMIGNGAKPMNALASVGSNQNPSSQGNQGASL